MANAIALAKLYEPLLQEAYNRELITSVIEGGQLVAPMRGALANEVYVPKMALEGLGDYSKSNGYPAGDITVEWVPFQLQYDRGKKFALDVVDDMESMKVAGANAMGQFIRFGVVPEVDAIRFARWSSGSKVANRAYATLSTGSNLVAAIDAGIVKLDEASVPSDGRILFLTPAMYSLLKAATWEKRMYINSDSSIGKDVVMFDSMRVIKVPQARFYSQCTTGDDGYTNSGAQLNFMIVHPSAVFAVTKHTALKSAEPDATIDAMRFAYRIYHDGFIVPNHEDGIYVHSKTSLVTNATPVFDVDDNNTTSPDFTLTCSTAGVTMYYTTDGTTPTSASTAYSSKVTLTTAGTYTVKAIAIKSGNNDSAVASTTITVTSE